MYAENVETIQDNSNKGSKEECEGYNGGGTVYVIDGDMMSVHQLHS